MKYTNKFIVYISFIMLSYSCAKPLLSNLQKGTFKYETTTEDVLKAGVSVLPLANPTENSEKPKTFFDLRDSLPHLYLKLLSEKVANPDSFISYLSKPLSEVSKKPADKKPTDYIYYKVRLSFFNLKEYYKYEKYMHPNTRLEYLTTTLAMNAGSNAIFYNIDRLENEYDEIDFGTLTRDQTVSLNAKLAGELGYGASLGNSATNESSNTSGDQVVNKENIYDAKGNVIGTIDKTGTTGGTGKSTSVNNNSVDAKAKANAEVGYLNTQTIKEAVAVKLKRLRTGFNLTQNNLTIAQRGRPNGEITDNIYVTAVLKASNPRNVFTLSVYDFANLFATSGEKVKANDITFKDRIVNFIPCDNAIDISLTTKYEGAIRVPGNIEKSNGVNALEYDDKVTFYKFGSTNGDPVVIDKNLYCKNAYKIIALNPAGDTLTLKISAPVPQELDIFVDDKPEVFLQWIFEQIADPTPSNLISTKFRLYFERGAAAASRIYLVKNAISSGEIATLLTLRNIQLIKRMP